MLKHRFSPVRLVLLLALGLGFLEARPALAQDAHYWAQGYGARADLLGGVVVGSLLDLSNTYYNPGALPLLEDPSLLLGTSAFELLSLTVSRDTTPERKLSTITLRPLSSFVAIPVAGSWAISYLNRFSANYTLNSREVTDTGGVPGFPSDGVLVGEVLYEQNLTESWGGLTWSRKLRENIGFGFTTYGSLRTQSLRNQWFAEAVAPAGDAASLGRLIDYSYYDVGLVWKAGLAVDNSPLTWGVSLTTPILSLFGSGQAFGTRSAVGIDFTGDGVPDPNLIAIEEDGVSTTYHSPVSISGGAEYSFGNTSLFVTAEWYNAVGAYQVLDLPPFVVSTAGDTLFIDSYTSARAVLNGGLGVEYQVSKDFLLYGSVITDFSAASGNPDDLFTTSAWDLYHASLGSKFRVSTVSLILGFGFAFGNKSLDVSPTEEIPEPEPGESKYRSMKLIVGVQTGL